MTTQQTDTPELTRDQCKGATLSRDDLLRLGYMAADLGTGSTEGLTARAVNLALENFGVPFEASDSLRRFEGMGLVYQVGELQRTKTTSVPFYELKR